MWTQGVCYLVFIAWFCQRDMALPHFEARAKAPCPSHNLTLLWTLAGFRKFIWLRDPQHFLLFVHDIDTKVHELVLSYSGLDSKLLVRFIMQHDCEHQQNPTVIGTALIQMQLQRFSLRAPWSSVRKLIWLRGRQLSLFSGQNTDTEHFANIPIKLWKCHFGILSVL